MHRGNPYSAPLGRLAGVLSAVCVLLIATLVAVVPVGAARAAAAVPPGPRVFAYYYLWWSAHHWQSALGPSYPRAAVPLPLPATLDAYGCNPRSNYPGNTLTDVPQRLYGQDDPGVIETEVRQAAAAGLAGFIPNWAGSGAATQTATSTPYSWRLKLLVDAVHKVNAEGIPFRLWISYKASAKILTASAISNDLRYFWNTYGSDPAFDRARSAKPTLIWQGSSKYPLSDLAAISAQYRATFRILGDESNWSPSRAAYLDGDAYYWSSQNPYTNGRSFTALANLANTVRVSGLNPDGTRKLWIAPFIPGFNKQLAGGASCVPRNNGETLRTLYHGNAATHPDDFGLISWNEITESTYVAPMTRYGSTGLTMLHALITGAT
jgi:hypothetical protein